MNYKLEKLKSLLKGDDVVAVLGVDKSNDSEKFLNHKSVSNCWDFLRESNGKVLVVVMKGERVYKVK